VTNSLYKSIGVSVVPGQPAVFGDSGFPGQPAYSVFIDIANPEIQQVSSTLFPWTPKPTNLPDLLAGTVPVNSPFSSYGAGNSISIGVGQEQTYQVSLTWIYATIDATTRVRVDYPAIPPLPPIIGVDAIPDQVTLELNLGWNATADSVTLVESNTGLLPSYAMSVTIPNLTRGVQVGAANLFDGKVIVGWQSIAGTVFPMYGGQIIPVSIAHAEGATFTFVVYDQQDPDSFARQFQVDYYVDGSPVYTAHVTGLAYPTVQQDGFEAIFDPTAVLLPPIPSRDFAILYSGGDHVDSPRIF
jgi:hypothetical protein